MTDDLDNVEHRDRSVLCRIGLYNWSEPRGGIKVCQRDGCRSVRTFGLSGTMRRMEWERELYDKYMGYTEGDDAE